MDVGYRLLLDLQNQLGVSSAVAAGIVGNLSHESNNFQDLQEISPLVPGSRGGYGYAQWTGPRREAFEKWSKDNNLDTSSYEANSGFLIHELQNTPEGNVLKSLQSVDSPEAAAEIFSNEYLRPGIPHMDKRTALAGQYANKALAGQQGDDLLEQKRLLLKRELLKQRLQKQKSLLLKRELLKQRLQNKEKVYRADTRELIEVPAGMSMDEIKYRDDIENRGKDKGDYFGFKKIGNPIDFVKRYIRGVAESGAALQAFNLDTYEKRLDRIQKLQSGEREKDIKDFLFGPRDSVFFGKTEDDFLSDEADRLRKKINELRVGYKQLPTVLDAMGLGNADSIIGDLGAGGQSLAQSIGLWIVTGNPMAASVVMGAQQKSRTYQEARGKGLDVDKASEAANIDALGVAALEAIGTNALVGTFSGSTLLKRTFKGFLTEGAEEGSQELWSILVKNGYDVTDTGFMEGVSQVLYAAFIGGILGGTVSGVSGPSLSDVGIKIDEGDMQILNSIASEYGRSAEVRQVAKQELNKTIDNEFSKERSGSVLSDAENILAQAEFAEETDTAEFLNQYMREEERGIFAAPKEMWDNFAYSSGKEISKLIVPISTRIRNISEPLMYRLRRFEMDTKTNIQKAESELVPFLKKWQKLDNQTKRELDILLKNGSREMIDNYAKKHNIQKEISQVRSMLDDIYARAKEAGVDVNYRSDFFPRHVTDPNSLLAFLEKQEFWNIIDQAIKNKEKNGVELTQEQKADVANTLLRGFRAGGVSLKDAGVFQKRTIEQITPELDKFYNTTDQSLIRYIVIANENIETKKLFGRATNTNDLDSLNKSIGEMTYQMMKDGEITSRQANDLREMFEARFNQGRMPDIVRDIKNLGYAAVMGSNPGTAITQFGDLSFSIMSNGFFNTINVWPKAWTGKSQQILDQTGITKIAEEYETKGLTANIVKKSFDSIGLSKIDRVGKTTLMTASLKRLTADAKKGKASLKQQLNYMFGDNAGQVLSDLKSGNMTDDIRFLMFNELLEMQPVALSEMPETYLRSGTGKIFYMLKSFTIKQIDVYRRYGVEKMIDGAAMASHGDVVKGTALFVEGFKNFTTLAAFLIAFGVGRDQLWDLMTGRELEDLDDEVVANIYKAFGLSKYNVDQLTRPYMPDMPGTFLMGQMAPPTKTLDNMYRDIFSKEKVELKDLRTWRSIPIGGELYWFWFGGGSDNKSSLKDGKFTVKSK